MARKNVVIYTIRCGPARGPADLEAAFPTKTEAVQFLVNAHGLTIEEQRQLAKSLHLKLDRVRHGSAGCAIREVALPEEEARLRLAG